MTPSQQRPTKRFFIQAGTFAQAAIYAKKNNLAPTQWTYLDRPEKLKGLRGSNVVVVKTGMYWQDRFASEIDKVIFLECPEAELKHDAEDSENRLEHLLVVMTACTLEEYEEAKERVIRCERRLLQLEKFRDALFQ